MKGQSKRWSLLEVAILKTISLILSYLFIGSLTKASIYVIITTIVYYCIRRLFNYIQLQGYKR